MQISIASSRMRLAGILLTISLAVGAAIGCSGATIRVPELVPLGVSLESTAVLLNRGLDTLSRVDPLGIRGVLERNDSLRAQLTRLAARLNSDIPGAGLVEIRNRRVQLRITQYTGTHRLNGWVDTPENAFFQNRGLNDRDIILPFRMDSVVHAVYYGTTGDGRSLPMIKAVAQSRADSLFRDFLKTAAIVPGPDLATPDLNTRFGTSGVHTVNLEITPVQADRNGRWQIVGQIVLMPPNGESEVFTEFEYSSDRYPTHALGTPLPVLTSVMKVRVGGT
jgi:hypothetical protein